MLSITSDDETETNMLPSRHVKRLKGNSASSNNGTDTIMENDAADADDYAVRRAAAVRVSTLFRPDTKWRSTEILVTFLA